MMNQNTVSSHNSGKRNCNVDILKFIFALIIVLYHSKNLVDVPGTSIFVSGVISVDFFFLTSGYFFANSIVKKPYLEGVSLGRDTKDFMIHKICGFLPNMYIAWLIAFAVGQYFRQPYSGSRLLDFMEGIWEVSFMEMTGIGEGGFIVNNVTWYVSAMLLAMFILYPIARKNKENFFYIIAPMISIILFGIMLKVSRI